MRTQLNSKESKEHHLLKESIKIMFEFLFAFLVFLHLHFMHSFVVVIYVDRQLH